MALAAPHRGSVASSARSAAGGIARITAAIEAPRMPEKLCHIARIAHLISAIALKEASSMAGNDDSGGTGDVSCRSGGTRNIIIRVIASGIRHKAAWRKIVAAGMTPIMISSLGLVPVWRRGNSSRAVPEALAHKSSARR